MLFLGDYQKTVRRLRVLLGKELNKAEMTTYNENIFSSEVELKRCAYYTRCPKY